MNTYKKFDTESISSVNSVKSLEIGSHEKCDEWNVMDGPMQDFPLLMHSKIANVWQIRNQWVTARKT